MTNKKLLQLATERAEAAKKEGRLSSITAELYRLQRKYRGKYPTKIQTIYSDSGKGVVCITNEGKRYRISPLTHKGRNRAPQLGDLIHDLQVSDDYAIVCEVA